MHFMDPNGPGWHYLVFALADLARYLAWCLMGGLVAWGTAGCAGCWTYQSWAEANPRPRRLTRGEGWIRLEVTRGIAEMEALLAERSTPGRHHSPQETEDPPSMG